MANELDPTTLHNIVDHTLQVDAVGRITVSATTLLRHGDRVPVMADAHRLLAAAVNAVQQEATRIENERKNKPAGQVDFSR